MHSPVPRNAHYEYRISASRRATLHSLFLPEVLPHTTTERNDCRADAESRTARIVNGERTEVLFFSFGIRKTGNEQPVAIDFYVCKRISYNSSQASVS